jgi:hypothetical protein
VLQRVRPRPQWSQLLQSAKLPFSFECPFRQSPAIDGVGAARMK